MTKAFHAVTANFAKMDGTGDLLIDEVAHQAFVAVNETGTEAAAAGAVVVAARGTPEEPSDMTTIDHPLIFVIRDLATGAILFMGGFLDSSV